MRLQLLILAGLALAAGLGQPPALVAQGTKQTAKQKKEGAKAQRAALTGCVDEQDGKYVLIQEQSRSVIAHLEAEGFPTEGFAKHLGHKVTVRGTSSPAGADSPVFKVQTVEPISDVCGSQH
jgi:hypothetical protein